MTQQELITAIAQLEADPDTPTNVGGVVLHRQEDGTPRIQFLPMIELLLEPLDIDPEIDGSIQPAAAPDAADPDPGDVDPGSGDSGDSDPSGPQVF